MSFLKNRTVVGVICILLSLLICFGLTPLFNQSVSQKAEIVRVVQPIRAGDEITESMVQIVEVGGYNLPEDVLRQKESAVGKYATADLAVGDYIIPSKLSDAPAAENAYLYSLDGSQQAISVSIKSFAEGLVHYAYVSTISLLLSVNSYSRGLSIYLPCHPERRSRHGGGKTQPLRANTHQPA